MMISLDLLKKMKKWVGFVGILTVAAVILYIIFYAILFVVGLRSGEGFINGIMFLAVCLLSILPFYMGILLLNTKKALNEIVSLEPEDQTPALTVALQNVTSYFKVIGVLSIIGFAAFVICMAAVFILGFYSHIRGVL